MKTIDRKTSPYADYWYEDYEKNDEPSLTVPGMATDLEKLVANIQSGMKPAVERDVEYMDEETEDLENPPTWRRPGIDITDIEEEFRVRSKHLSSQGEELTNKPQNRPQDEGSQTKQGGVPETESNG